MILDIKKYDVKSNRKYPLYLSKISAGFPSPADDYIEKSIDLNEYLINHPASTFFVRVKGDSMINAGIQNGSVLIVDRSLEAINNKIIVAVLNGEFTVKRIKKYNGSLFLIAENPNYSPIEVTSNMDFEVWGVVVHVIHSV
ncbi:MAG: translesion error-prone DNA polymerase V autoproteolytic subunit [Candidatus Omnitrophica bacterium]|nr:translesion error-prone DNA polymerase V autoproteolytic subunit [Candidatus Omnitrophota bacterium]